MRLHIKLKAAVLTLIAALLMCAGAYGIYGQEADINGNITKDGYSGIMYNNNNGLPTSEANAIVQSGNGFIWIGSYSGLIRYDGNDFVRYDSSTGITSVVSLYVDSGDRLWIGTNDNGIAMYDNGSFRFYGRKEGLSSLSVRSITEDGSGNIVIGTTHGLAYIDCSGELHILEDSRIDGEYVCELQRDEDGLIYGVTLEGDAFLVESLAVTSFLDGEKLGIGISCICPIPGKKGCVYLGTWASEVISGSFGSGMEDREVLSVYPQVNINAIRSLDGRVWVCADNGIGYIEADKTYTMLNNIEMNNSVDDMMRDYEGNLWFVSSRQGVMEITSNPFTDISRIAGLESMVVNSTCMFRGCLYIGTDTGLVILDDNMQRVDNALTELMSGIRIRCIKEDSAGRLWLCSYGDTGLVCYEGGDSYTIYNTQSGLASNWVRAMTELSDKTVAAAVSGGLSLIRDGKVVKSYTEKDGIDNTEILTVCDGGGKIYLGSDGGGIYVIDNGSVSRIGTEDGLKSEVILRIKKDPEKDLYWIITGNSIAYMENEKITTVTSFPYSNNFDMYFGKSGEMWILSSNGIYVINREAMLANEASEYSFYDSQCGLPYVATANSRSFIADDGTLYISGSSGVCSICVDEKRDSDSDIKLSIPFAEIDNQMVNIKDGETVTVPADSKRLTIYGYALTYTLNNPHLSYCLEGFDESPVMTTGNSMQPVSYTNLDSGEYVFRLSVINNLTGETENSISVTFVKEKAFYEHIWFWILITAGIIAIAAAVVILYIRHKTASLLKKQEENKRFINQMICAFAKSIDLKDKYTNGHSFRVAKYSEMIAKKMGYTEAQASDIYNIALLHDIGKITIPEEILNKPGRLTDEEYEIIKRHAINGYDILKEIETFPELALGAGFHHERIDGKGYPSGKKGNDIPKIARIIAVADTFDAMNSTRPYRKQMKMEDISEELKRVSGTQLDEDIVKILLVLIDNKEV